MQNAETARKTVINGLEKMTGKLDYAPWKQLLIQAIDMLKKDAPRILSLNEVECAIGTVAWVESNGEPENNTYALIESYNHTMSTVWMKCLNDGLRMGRTTCGYGKTWRCWNKRPSQKLLWGNAHKKRSDRNAY